MLTELILPVKNMNIKKEISIGDILHLLAFFIAIISFFIAGLAWKRGVDDHFDNLDTHVIATNKRINTENNTIIKLDDKIDQIDEREARVEGVLHRNLGN